MPPTWLLGTSRCCRRRYCRCMTSNDQLYNFVATGVRPAAAAARGGDAARAHGAHAMGGQCAHREGPPLAGSDCAARCASRRDGRCALGAARGCWGLQLRCACQAAVRSRCVLWHAVMLHLMPHSSFTSHGQAGSLGRWLLLHSLAHHVTKLCPACSKASHEYHAWISCMRSWQLPGGLTVWRLLVHCATTQRPCFSCFRPSCFQRARFLGGSLTVHSSRSTVLTAAGTHLRMVVLCTLGHTQPLMPRPTLRCAC